MTVAELMRVLSEMNPEAIVEVRTPCEASFNPVESVESFYSPAVGQEIVWLHS
jgi:hypothetical protein